MGKRRMVGLKGGWCCTRVGTHSLICVPSLLRSCGPGILGTQECGNANILQECGERGTRKSKNANFVFLNLNKCM